MRIPAGVAMEYDVFISYASEDKEIVRQLAQRLKELGVKIWFDEFELKGSDDLREKIDRALSQSKFGIVILSDAYFSKSWTKKELNGLFAKEDTGEVVIIPIWHNITKKEVISHSPMLAGRLALSTDRGVDYVAQEIRRILGIATPNGSNGVNGDKIAKAFRDSLRITLSYVFEMMSIFLLVYLFRNKQSLAILAGSMSVFGGGLVWQYLCKKNGWEFHLGHKKEPYGVYAAVWGSIMIFPIVLSAAIVCDLEKLYSPQGVFLWMWSYKFGFVCTYTLLAGLAGVCFYGLQRQWSIRTRIETILSWSDGGMREAVIIILWSMIMTLGPIPALLIPLNGESWILYLIPTVLSVLVCVPVLVLYIVTIPPHIDPDRSIRGIFAGPAIRAGLYIGLLIVLNSQLREYLQKILLLWLNKRFDAPE